MNHRPHGPEPCALTRLSYAPIAIGLAPAVAAAQQRPRILGEFARPVNDTSRGFIPRKSRRRRRMVILVISSRRNPEGVKRGEKCGAEDSGAAKECVAAVPCHFEPGGVKRGEKSPATERCSSSRGGFLGALRRLEMTTAASGSERWHRTPPESSLIPHTLRST